jgi:hypothetical protein
MTAASVTELSGAVASPPRGNARQWQSAALWLRHEGVYALLSCLIPLICVLIAKPFAKAGFNDDWSYSHIALKLAETGRFQYDSYGSPMLLSQSIWAAAWIRIFGFSFDLLRVATLPFSLGFVLLVYLLGRKVGLKRDLALFGALVVGTSPLFFPLAASFMTEPYGCFFTTLCLYAAICTGEAAGSRRAAVWLWVLALAGILGGSDRQTVWVAPLALIPYLCWVRRRDRHFLVHAVLAYAVCLASLAVLVHWFKPPYAAFSLSNGQMLEVIRSEFPWAVGRLFSLFLTGVLYSLPAFLCFAELWRKLGSARVITLVFMCTLGALCLIVIMGPMGVAPYLGGLLTQYGLLWPGQDALGFRPKLLPGGLRIGISILVLLSGIIFCLLYRREKRGSMSPIAKAVLGIFCFAYLPLLLPGALLGILYDRYALPVIPALVVFVLYQFQPYGRKVPRTAWASLVVFAAYATMTTHDYFSASRARIQVSDLLQRRGVPRTHISAGFEYDGWTQLESTGNIQGVRYRDAFEWNSTDRFWFWSYTKALQPEYVVMCLRRNSPDTKLPSIAFTSWWPPFQRFAVAQMRDRLPRGKTCYSLSRVPCAIPVP